MATSEFQRLVRMDPENAALLSFTSCACRVCPVSFLFSHATPFYQAKCNGYLNSAILYLRQPTKQMLQAPL